MAWQAPLSNEQRYRQWYDARRKSRLLLRYDIDATKENFDTWLFEDRQRQGWRPRELQLVSVVAHADTTYCKDVDLPGLLQYDKPDSPGCFTHLITEELTPSTADHW